MTKHDPDFTAESIALGYHPFVRFSPLEYYAMRELYGDFAFGEIFPRLKDPGKLHPDWAARFMWAAALLPREEVMAAEDVYALVTSVTTFARRGPPHHKEFSKAFARAYQTIKSGGGDVPETEKPIYLADCERWQLELKERNEAKKNEQRLKAEKAARRAKAQAEEQAAIARKAAAAKAAEKPAEPAKPLAQAKPKPAEQKPTPPAKKPSEPIVERKSGVKPTPNYAIPSTRGVWRNPNSQAASGAPRPASSGPVTVIRKSEAK